MATTTRTTTMTRRRRRRKRRTKILKQEHEDGGEEDGEELGHLQLPRGDGAHGEVRGVAHGSLIAGRAALVLKRNRRRSC